MISANSTVGTLNAAANAIDLAEIRATSPTSEKCRWNVCWSIYCCFGSQKHNNRIKNAVLLPITTPSQTEQSSSITIPFRAPPSSPASSAAPSPANLFTLSSDKIYSPSGPRSIFAVGPYADETQLVSPPVFSTFNTEPSTAPFTPPLTTRPSSPEVPFAKLLDPSLRSDGVGPRFAPAQHEFHNYHFYPGSPLDHQLISPGSVVSRSGTSSPFLDHDQYFADGRYYPDVRRQAGPFIL